jgi:L-lactate dehydrogenase complex protein LldG
MNADRPDGPLDSRDDILARVRRNQPAPRPLPAIPTFERPLASPLESFRTGVLRMGGKFEAPAPGESVAALVQRLFPDARTVASAVPDVEGNRRLDASPPAALHDVDVGVVRALFGVAETGSVWLDERQFKVNALGFLVQHLVVLLDPHAIVGNLHEAYRDRARFDVRYGVFMTGPSATADIEGILIHGAQGIRSLTIVPAAASPA